MSDILEQISAAVIEGDLDEIQDLTEDALDDEISAEEVAAWAETNNYEVTTSILL